jgi:hypothetical protein
MLRTTRRPRIPFSTLDVPMNGPMQPTTQHHDPISAFEQASRRTGAVSRPGRTPALSAN